jgi:hypothetical protein
MTDEVITPAQVAENERQRLAADATSQLTAKKTEFDLANNPLSEQVRKMQDFIGDQTKMSALMNGSPEARREWEALQRERDPTAEALANVPLTYQQRMTADVANDLRASGLDEATIEAALRGELPADVTKDAMILKQTAIARRYEIMNDPELSRRYLAGDYELVKNMRTASTILLADVAESGKK